MTDVTWTADLPPDGAYADVNGIRLWHTSTGTGRPLVLLHGGLGSGEMFGPILPLLAAGRRVITVDLQGHGRTADIDRPITLAGMAGDIAALSDHLGLGQADLMGYSLGGGVALQVAVRHPELVRRLILVSAYVRSTDPYPEIRAQQGAVSAAIAPMMEGTPMLELYRRVAPRPEDFPRLLDKMGAWMAEPFDLSSDLAAVRVPTLFASADADMFSPVTAAETFRLLDGGLRDGGWMREGRPAGGHALAIIPNATHYDVFQSPVLAAAAIAFLDAPDR
ncbi:MAG: alpha/beta fold hydrolase [Chloroflexota bacterium]